jgi:hypothetical protein
MVSGEVRTKQPAIRDVAFALDLHPRLEPVFKGLENQTFRRPGGRAKGGRQPKAALDRRQHRPLDDGRRVELPAMVDGTAEKEFGPGPAFGVMEEEEQGIARQREGVSSRTNPEAVGAGFPGYALQVDLRRDDSTNGIRSRNIVSVTA